MSEFIARMFAAVESGELELLRNCYEPNATIWLNIDQTDRNVDDMLVNLGRVRASAAAMTYGERRLTYVGKLCFAQYVMRITQGDRNLNIPAMARIELSGSGRIKRLEEYFDSAPLLPSTGSHRDGEPSEPF